MREAPLIGLISFFVMLCSEQSKVENTPLRWKHYSLHGFVIDLPDIFKKGFYTNTAIQWFDAVDTSIKHGDYDVAVECLSPESPSNHNSLKRAFEEKLGLVKGYEVGKLSYSVLKSNFFIVSWSGRECGACADQIYYEKGILQHGELYQLHISYELQYKPLFDTILPRISASFH